MKRIVVLLLAIVLVCAGCKQEDNDNVSNEPETVVDWKTKGFQIIEDIEIAPEIWAEEYRQWEHGTGDFDNKRVGHIASGVLNNKMWFFGLEMGEDGKYVLGDGGEYILEIYDVNSGEYEIKDFTPADLGINDDLGYLVGMDMINENSFMFRWAGYSVDEEDMYSQVTDAILFTDLNGNNRQIDFRNVLLEEEIETYSKNIWTAWPHEKCYTDGKGNIWCIKHSLSGNLTFFLFDQMAEKMMQYEVEKGDAILLPIRTADGELILPIYSDEGKKYSFLWVDTVNKKFVSLGQISAKSPFITQICGMFGNDIYYRTRNPQSSIGEGIVRWNIESGIQTWIYEFKISEMSNYDSLLVCDESNELTMRLIKGKGSEIKDWIVPLGENESTDNDSIIVADFTGTNVQLEICASKASMELPNIGFVYKDVSAEEDRTREFAELSKGKGADIMFVSMEDYYSLLEKGLLLDLDTVVSESLYDELLPAVLEIGKENGTLWAMPVGVRAETFAINSDIAEGRIINLETLISLFEGGKLKGGIRSPYVMNEYLSPLLAMQILTDFSLNNSFLINWDKRMSCFDDDRFIRLLECMDTDISGIEEEGWQETDLVWGYFLFEWNMVDFFANVEAKNMEVIGYPGYDAVGFLIPNGGVVVVNKNTTNKQEVSLFLELLFGEEIQSYADKHCLSVRKMEVENYLKTNEDGELVFMGGQDAPQIPMYEDGSTPVHMAKDFLEACMPAPREYNQINKIITEELSAMYKEGKNAEEVAKIIDKRVQLYLDETETQME